VVLVATALSLRAQGGPPLRTDDAGTPGPGVWELNLAAAVDWVGDRAAAEAPLLDLNYGVGERVQLKLEVPWVVVFEEGEAARSGLGNSQVGVKWRFLDQGEHPVDLSVYPQLEFNSPTSSAERGIVEEGTEFRLPFQVQKAFGGLALNLELGWVATAGEDEWVYGLAAGVELLEGIELLAEVNGGAESDFGDDELIFQVGGRWALADRATLLWAVGRGLRHPAEGEIQLVAYLGVQFLFGG
jgi:hypothetical protein